MSARKEQARRVEEGELTVDTDDFSHDCGLVVCEILFQCGLLEELKENVVGGKFFLLWSVLKVSSLCCGGETGGLIFAS